MTPKSLLWFIPIDKTIVKVKKKYKKDNYIIFLG
jgi:hypothetical protein